MSSLPASDQGIHPQQHGIPMRAGVLLDPSTGSIASTASVNSNSADSLLRGDGLHHWQTVTIRGVQFARCSCEFLTYSDVSGALPESCPMASIDEWEIAQIRDIKERAARDRSWLRGHYRNEATRMAQTMDLVR